MRCPACGVPISAGALRCAVCGRPLERPAGGRDTSPRAPGEALVGREQELAALRAGLYDVLAGRGRLFLLVGEPGIGKTRLAGEIAALAQSRRARVLVGRAWETEGAPPYWPWAQIVRALLAGDEGA